MKSVYTYTYKVLRIDLDIIQCCNDIFLFFLCVEVLELGIRNILLGKKRKADPYLKPV